MNSYDLLREPVLTERSMTPVYDREGNEIKKYTFKVPVTANKVEIKQAVEEVFGVKVQAVNTIRMEGKMKRMGRSMGRRPAYKKAIVTLASGSKTIEFFEM
ncbi:MAG: 50S ribosomal protein L23 [Clostridia bacterium]|nr:50S ribosomal protein L23 [Clostridia bacterium]